MFEEYASWQNALLSHSIDEIHALLKNQSNNDAFYLHLAVKVGRLDVVFLLVHLGWSVNAKMDKRTALHIAAEKPELIEILQFLIQKGASPLEDDEKNLPLHLAAIHDNLVAVKKLISCPWYSHTIWVIRMLKGKPLYR